MYLGPDVRGLNSSDDIRLDGPIRVSLPQVGESYGIWYFDNAPNIDAGVQNDWRLIENLIDADLSRTELEAKAVSLQSKLLWDNLVGMYALRNDVQQVWRRLQEDNRRVSRTLGSPGGGNALQLLVRFAVADDDENSLLPPALGFALAPQVSLAR